MNQMYLDDLYQSPMRPAILPMAQENEQLHLQNDSLIQSNLQLTNEVAQLKQELYQHYSESLENKQAKVGASQREADFIKECSNELHRLKDLMKDVIQEKIQQPTEREEIKDRIIITLEDQLLNAKIMLRQFMGSSMR